MRTVILVSDSIDLSKSLRVMMNLSSHYRILDIASDKELGLMMVKENRPEMIFIRLALRWGLLSSFIENIKSESPNTKCVVIIDHYNDTLKAERCGADEVLQKGFTIGRLNQLIQKLYPPQTILQ